MPSPRASQALSRFTVLDLTRVRSGPTCVRQLADWGANVIKIEMPPDEEGGDPAVARELAARFDTEFEKLCAKWFRSGASHLVRHRADDEARMGQRAWLGDGTTPFERSPVDL